MYLSIFAVLCAVTALMLMWKRSAWKRTQAVLMLVVGLALSGSAGALRDRLMHLASSTSASATQKVFGVGVAYAIALVIVLWFFLDMDLDGLAARVTKKKGGKNKHTTTGFTPWLALLVPVALAALPLVNGLPDLARSGATALAASLAG
jgi:hypothetical protein